MPDIWVYIVGGVVISILILAIAYVLISNSINFSEKQMTLNEFSELFTDVQSVCLGEVNNSLTRQYTFAFNTRVIYATNLTNSTLPKVVDLIKNQNISSGFKLCLQFKDEQNLRCLPEAPEFLFCNTTMPYIGVLPENEDIWMMVNKILGKPRTREFFLNIKKINETIVNISIG